MDSVTPTISAGRPRVREIDYHFTLTRIALGSDEIIRLLATMLLAQAKQACELHNDQPEFYHTLGEVREALSDLAAQPGSGSQSQGLRVSLWRQINGLRTNFEHRARVLDHISREVRSQVSSAAIGLCEEAACLLDSETGMAGSDRPRELDRALKLLHSVVDIPGAADDTVSWYQIGWLEWAHRGDLHQAEIAFQRALKCSREEWTSHRADVLRHLAQVYYETGKLERAAHAAGEAASVSDDLDAAYDRARYASCLSLDDEVTALLCRCVAGRPTTFISMLSEEDFHRDS